MLVTIICLMGLSIPSCFLEFVEDLSKNGTADPHEESL